MIVNKERLERLIDRAVVCCEDCPLESELECDKYCQKVDEDTHLKSCAEALLDWLQEFDIAEALEEGAHIVNDQVIFPPSSLPDDFMLNVPCDFGEACTPSCSYFDKCPFEDD